MNQMNLLLLVCLLILLVGVLGGVAFGVWFWLRSRRRARRESSDDSSDDDSADSDRSTPSSLLFVAGANADLPAESSVLSKSATQVRLRTNTLPDHPTDTTTLAEGGAYFGLPGPCQEEATITLRGARSDLWSAAPPPVEQHNPTFGDAGYVGRPHADLLDFEHWSPAKPPKEILSLDPAPNEALDVPAGGFGGGYQMTNYVDGGGKFRLDVLPLVKGLGGEVRDSTGAVVPAAQFENLQYVAGGIGTRFVTGRLKNDAYYAHTQPAQGGPGACANNLYHYHGFRAGEVLNLANKVVGYSLDGYAIMGHNTSVLEPTMNAAGDVALTASSTSAQKPGKSGYRIKSTAAINSISSVGKDGSLRLRSVFGAPGACHCDYSYSNVTGDVSSHRLDRYNMGFVLLRDGANGTPQLEKVYVLTDDYPYSIHTKFFQGA
jgi:hypothetical protein